ncbi:MAG TPA: SDR family oxidoreductase [Longimicrobiales bacterium]|nr:SDR family oxidoreductase [Longimicrobiales bacterium]
MASDSRVILITGTSSGIGFLAARALAQEGHRVYATMRDPLRRNAAVADDLRRIGEASQGEIRVIELDAASDGAAREAVEEALTGGGRLDVLVNNAGSMFVGPAEAFTPAQLNRQLDVNVTGPFRLMRAAAPAMRAAGEGLVVNVSSIAGRFSRPFAALYHASKWALEGLSQAMRYELSVYGIDVVLIEPGPYRTNLQKAAEGPEDRVRLESLGRLTEIQTEMASRFYTVFDDPSAPTDPAEAARAIVEVIGTPAGERPFRTVVGIDFGMDELNRKTAPYYEGVLESYGVREMRGVRRPSAPAEPGDEPRPEKP